MNIVLPFLSKYLKNVMTFYEDQDRNEDFLKNQDWNHFFVLKESRDQEKIGPFLFYGLTNF